MKGHAGWKICAGIIQSREQHVLMLDVPKDKVVPSLGKRLEAGPKKCRMVFNGPVKDRVMIGDKVDLTKLPVVTHSTTCDGPYIGSGTCITKDPDSGVRNLACLRTSLSTEYPMDKLGFIEPITGEPVELVKCETIDIEVPTNAEIVLEGEISPKVRVGGALRRIHRIFEGGARQKHVADVQG